MSLEIDMQVSESQSLSYSFTYYYFLPVYKNLSINISYFEFKHVIILPFNIG